MVSAPRRAAAASTSSAASELEERREKGVKVVVDSGLCESNARCVEVCPEVFLVNEHEELVIVNAYPSERLRAKVEAAVLRCPRQALSIEG